MKILGLDPATKTGWAHSDGDSGVRHIGISGQEHAGQKLVRFRDWLHEMLRAYTVDRIAFEFSSLGSKHEEAKVFHNQLRGVLIMVAAEFNLPFRSFSPSQIKKFATGNGRASKEEVMRCFEVATGRKAVDDNEADAYWVLHLAEQDYRVKSAARQKKRRQKRSPKLF